MSEMAASAERKEEMGQVQNAFGAELTPVARDVMAAYRARDLAAIGFFRLGDALKANVVNLCIFEVNTSTADVLARVSR